jgi:hypothetical protein
MLSIHKLLRRWARHIPYRVGILTGFLDFKKVEWVEEVYQVVRMDEN